MNVLERQRVSDWVNNYIIKNPRITLEDRRASVGLAFGADNDDAVVIPKNYNTTFSNWEEVHRNMSLFFYLLQQKSVIY